MKVYINSVTKKIIAISSDLQDLSKFYINCFVLTVDQIKDKILDRKVWVEKRDEMGNVIWEQDTKTGYLSPKKDFVTVKTRVTFTSQPYMWSLEEILD